MRRTLIVTFLVAALGLGGYLGYRYYSRESLPEPSPSPKKSKPSVTGKVDVVLPDELKQQLEKDQQLQKQFYSRAVENHTAGNYEKAIENYRKAIAQSSQDQIAARSYRYLGDIYSEGGELKEAARLYRFALKVDPDNAQFHYRLALTYKKLQQFDSAEDHFNKAVQINPTSTYYLGKGNLHFVRDEYLKAARSYEQGIQYESHLDRLYVNLGLSRQRLGDKSKALDAYKSALNQDLSSQLRYLVLLNRGKLLMDLGRFSDAVTSFERASSIDPTYEVLFNMGLARYETKNYEGSIQAFRAALNRDSDDPATLKNLGFVYEQVEDYDNSIRYYKRALEVQPENEDLYLALGRSYEKNNQPREALQAYRKMARRLNPGDKLALVLRRVGELYLKIGNPQNATPAFRNVLRMTENNHEVHYNLGIAYRRSGQLEMAIEQFRKALEIKPDSTQYRISLADTQYRAGFRKEAQKTYRKITQGQNPRRDAEYMVAYLDYTFGDLESAKKGFQALLPRVDSSQLKAMVYQSLGNVYLKNEEYTQAKTAYRKSLDQKKTPETYFNHGLVALHQEEWDVAMASFRKALRLQSDNPQYQAALGLALYQRGLYCEAKKQLEQSLSTNPDNLRAQYDLKKVREALAEEGKTCDIGNRA